MSRKYEMPPSGPERKAWFWSGFKSSASVSFLKTPVGAWFNPPTQVVTDDPPWLAKRKAERAAKQAGKNPYRVPVYEWETTVPVSDWMDEAACGETKLESFFPSGVREYRKNQSWRPFCDSCPVAKQCLQFGRESSSIGVYGGVFLDERRDEYDVEREELQS